jgi:hypothetical protein
MSDGIDLSTVQIHNSHDVKSWPVTATITKLEFRPTGVHVEHTRNQGPESWPNFRPAGWDGDLQYTLWIFLQIAGRWHGSGCIQFWQSCDQNGGPPDEFAKNWYYDANRWAPMTGHQPAPGELVGFMVSAGDARNNGAQSLQERSNVVAMPFPASGAVYVAQADVAPVVPGPDPVTPAVVHTPDVLDELRREIAALSRKVDALMARSAPVYRGTLPAVPALGVPAGTVVLKPEVDGDGAEG